jgi:HD-GYP domain-containing protein (c-di-GMP phosphodiesterase class II)
VVGHRIVSGVQFPWQQLPDVVRWHHERADGSGYPDNLTLGELPLSARIVAVADTFDAMTSERPYRTGMTIGGALTEMVRLTPALFDPAAVQALLIQVRREAVGGGQARLLDEHTYCNISPTDVDQLASSLSYKLSQGRTYSS